MKKNIIAAAFAATAALTMSNAFASAGTVNFTGEIIDAACTVDAGSENQTVDLGRYSKSEFTAAGDKTAATKFSIVLTDCPATVTGATIKFDGSADPANSNLLAVTGGATGVAINLMTADSQDLPLAGVNSHVYSLAETVPNTLDFFAQYEATSATVGVGPANGVANFSVSYQ